MTGHRYRRADAAHCRGRRLAVYATRRRCTGHAVEARICAEDPADNFHALHGQTWLTLVSRCGRTRRKRRRKRIDRVTPYYDSMLAKLITHAETRDKALDKLSSPRSMRPPSSVSRPIRSFLARSDRIARDPQRHVSHQVDRRADRSTRRQDGGTGRRGVRAGSVFLDDAPTPAGDGSLRQNPVALSRETRLADVEPATTDYRRSRSCTSRRRGRPRRSALRHGTRTAA